MKPLRNIFYTSSPKVNLRNSFSSHLWINDLQQKTSKQDQSANTTPEGLDKLIKANGLKTVLLRDSRPTLAETQIFDRTLIAEPESNKVCPSDTKSTKSESNSLHTFKSSTSNGANSKQSNNDVMTPQAFQEEDLIQKYYKELRNSLKNCIITKKTNIHFKDIGGNSYAKKIIQEAFVLPNLVPSYFTGRPKAWNKILLYGPPGVGKTMMAQAVCNEIRATVFWVSLADITSKFIGESEKLLRMLFELAKEKSPSIIIIDEMDSIGRKRNGSESETERRIKTEFLRQMDEINSGTDGVHLLATTNMPWELDIACLRRFEKKLLIPMPDVLAREEIFRLSIGNHPTNLKEEDFKSLAKLTDGYTGSDISNIVNDAMMRPVRMLQEACFFKVIKKIEKEKKPYPCSDLGDNMDELGQEEEVMREYYVPCNSNEAGAVKKNLTDIPKEHLMPRKVEMTDFKDSIKNCKPTVSASFVDLYNKFLMKYGHKEQEGDLFKMEKTYQHYYL